MSDDLQILFDQLPRNLGNHMLLSVAALLVGLAISVPLGIVVSRRATLAEGVLGVAGVLQTVPSLALLALMVLVLHRIGFWPALLALVLYSILPILANTIIGLKGVDAAVVEAARGLGMTDRQMLFGVQLPLAAPVIISGIRTAAVIIVGTATLATPVGTPSLGNYIFAGLATHNPTLTLFGCVLAAGLAVTIDQLIRLVEYGARRRSRRMVVVGLVCLLALFTGGLYAPLSRIWPGRGEPVNIAFASFTEQQILGELLKLHLTPQGFNVNLRGNTSEGAQVDGLENGQIDCAVGYTGNILTLQMAPKEYESEEQAYYAVTKFLRDQKGIECLGKLGFQDNYVMVVRRDPQKKMESIQDLADHYRRRNEAFVIAGDEQIFSRPEWLRLKEKYGIFEVETKVEDASFLCDDVNNPKSGVDAAIAYSSDGRIALFNLQTLKDPQRVFPLYDGILLLSERAAGKERFVAALRPLCGRITQELMMEANLKVDVQKRSIREAAVWLLEEALSDG